MTEITNCYIEVKPGQDATSLLRIIDGYAIVPRERFDAFLARLAEAERLLWKIHHEWDGEPEDMQEVGEFLRATDSAPADRVPYCLLLEEFIDTTETAINLTTLADWLDQRAATPNSAEPSRSKRMTDAGYPKRDDRLECDGCGKLFTAQLLPIHKCEADSAEEGAK